MPLGNSAHLICKSIRHPPQFPAEHTDPVRTQDIHNYGNLGASPPKFAVAGSEGFSFKLRWKHD
jgi:hypothetical protein